MATINLPGFQWPASSTEYVLAMAAYLMGIFIVASIIGEVSATVADWYRLKMISVFDGRKCACVCVCGVCVCVCVCVVCVCLCVCVVCVCGVCVCGVCARV